MISLKHAVAKKIWILMFIGASFSSVSFGARVFWNECVDMGGVDIDINTKKCMCVNGDLFDPRKKDSEFICDGVGTRLYHIMLGQGKYDHRKDSKGVNVVKKYKYFDKLDYQCVNYFNAACYSPKASACVCKNNYHIDLTSVRSYTRDCYGTSFVGYGANLNPAENSLTSTHTFNDSKPDNHISLRDRFSKMTWTLLPNEGTPTGRFDGVLEIQDHKTCGFISGSDTNGLKCSTIRVQDLQFVSIDFSETFDVKNPPSCIAQIIGPTGDIRVVDITNEKLVLSYKRTNQTVANNNGVPAGCRKEDSSKKVESYTLQDSSIIKASVQCAFVD